MPDKSAGSQAIQSHVQVMASLGVALHLLGEGNYNISVSALGWGKGRNPTRAVA